MSTEQRYLSLIARLERQAREAPGAYKFRLAMLAGLGFAVLGGSVLLALGMSVGLFAVLIAISPLLLLKLIKVVWIPLVLAWMILRALWLKFDPPEGYTLAAGEAPELQAEVERLRRGIGAPRLSGIVIDGELNAAAVSLPRGLGLLGNRHYLVLGLPLMQSLDREQLLAVIAHEFGHFGGGHARFAGWIYRVRVAWLRVLHALAAQQAMLTGVFVRFFRWYAPYFNAYSFVLARGNEYEADAIAARMVGAPAVAQALVRSDACGEFLHKGFWPALQQQVAAQPEPPRALFQEMAERLRAPRESDAERLAAALARRPDYDDTHPTLAQRLSALGVAPAPTAAPAQTAAQALLGPLLPTLEQRLSEQWRAGMEPVWEEEHQRLRAGAERLATLEDAPAPSLEERIERARLTEQLRPQTDALPLFAALAEDAQEDAFVRFRLGALLLERDDPAGVGHLREAMRLNADATESACELLDAYYRKVGDGAGRAWVEQTLETLYGRQSQAWRQRSQVRADDVLLPHGLDEAALAALRTALAGTGKVKAAWLARKRIDDPSPDALPHFLLLVQLGGLVLDEDGTLQKVVDAVELPGTFSGFTAAHQRGLSKRLKQQAGAAIYRR